MIEYRVYLDDYEQTFSAPPCPSELLIRIEGDNCTIVEPDRHDVRGVTGDIIEMDDGLHVEAGVGSDVDSLTYCGPLTEIKASFAGPDGGYDAIYSLADE